MAITVLIVEDDPQFRAAFVAAIDSSRDIVLVAEAEDLPAGLRMLDEKAPDVLLVDIGLPSGSGIDLIRRAALTLPDCDVMVVTVFGDERHVIECLEAGATGYLLKGARAPDICDQIRALRAGGSPISPVIARQLLLRMTPQTQPAEGATLSEQERNVLSLAAKGYSYEEIAVMLQRSHHTVETHVKRIYRKLQVHNKAEAVYEARKLGLMRD
jgi:DNA-binding NarL/FixJ family response regulator